MLCWALGAPLLSLPLCFPPLSGSQRLSNAWLELSRSAGDRVEQTAGLELQGQGCCGEESQVASDASEKLAGVGVLASPAGGGAWPHTRGVRTHEGPSGIAAEAGRLLSKQGRGRGAGQLCRQQRRCGQKAGGLRKHGAKPQTLATAVARAAVRAPAWHAEPGVWRRPHERKERGACGPQRR